MSIQTLHGHSAPITSLDFSEPYGTLVSASQDDSQPRVWDLLQVDDLVCLTGGEDGNVRMWDLRRVDEDEWGVESETVSLSDVPEEDEEGGDGEQRSTGVHSSDRESVAERDDSCVRVLEGHSKAVTALYFEDDCLVSLSFISRSDAVLTVHR
jgi:division protein 1